MKKHHLTLVFIIYILLTGCSSMKERLIPTYNKGGYKIKAIKAGHESNNLNISGKVYDIKNSRPLSNVQLSLGCIKTQNLPNGEYSFIIKNDLVDNHLFIEAISIGYRTIQTNFIKIIDENEIIIDFYLAEDDRPFINCEGIN